MYKLVAYIHFILFFNLFRISPSTVDYWGSELSVLKEMMTGFFLV